MTLRKLQKMAIHAMRISYEKDVLLEPACPSSPFVLFDHWFADAVTHQSPESEPNGVCLSTCNTQGRPSSRMVLLKSFDQNGFVFYTNYNSRKALELQSNPFASMVFWWGQRSVRIEGAVEKTSEEEATAYFNSRPRGSQLGAWTSPQSSGLRDRQELEDLEAQIKERFANVDPIPKPPHWGGFRLVPDTIEFWQVCARFRLTKKGRPSRLHDRIKYTRLSPDSTEWKFIRLAP